MGSRSCAPKTYIDRRGYFADAARFDTPTFPRWAGVEESAQSSERAPLANVAGRHRGPRRPRAQPRRTSTSSIPTRPPRRDHRPLGLGEVDARLRHPLRRGPASLRGVALRLRAPVPRADGRSPTSTPSRGSRPPSRSSRRAVSRNPRSTVGTITEIHDYLRVLFARVGRAALPEAADRAIARQTVQQMTDRILMALRRGQPRADPRSPSSGIARGVPQGARGAPPQGFVPGAHRRRATPRPRPRTISLSRTASGTPSRSMVDRIAVKAVEAYGAAWRSRSRPRCAWPRGLVRVTWVRTIRGVAALGAQRLRRLRRLVPRDRAPRNLLVQQPARRLRRTLRLASARVEVFDPAGASSPTSRSHLAEGAIAPWSGRGRRLALLRRELLASPLADALRRSKRRAPGRSPLTPGRAEGILLHGTGRSRDPLRGWSGKGGKESFSRRSKDGVLGKS